MRNLWQIHLDLIKLEEEIDRLVLRKSRERLISEKERLSREIDSMLAKELELKHKLQKIEVDKKKKKNKGSISLPFIYYYLN